MTPGPARQALRAATAGAHHDLEALPLSRKLFSGKISPAELGQFFAAMLACYRPIERAGSRILAADYRRRGPLLHAGLQALGGTAVADSDPPLMDCEASALGVRYVIEGSALGGELIRRRLNDRFAPAILAFFEPNGDTGDDIWRCFQQTLEDRLVTDQAVARAVEAAVATFRSFQFAISRVSDDARHVPLMADPPLM